MSERCPQCHGTLKPDGFGGQVHLTSGKYQCPGRGRGKHLYGGADASRRIEEDLTWASKVTVVRAEAAS